MSLEGIDSAFHTFTYWKVDGHIQAVCMCVWIFQRRQPETLKRTLSEICCYAPTLNHAIYVKGPHLLSIFLLYIVQKFSDVNYLVKVVSCSAISLSYQQTNWAVLGGEDSDSYVQQWVKCNTLPVGSATTLHSPTINTLSVSSFGILTQKIPSVMQIYVNKTVTNNGIVWSLYFNDLKMCDKMYWCLFELCPTFLQNFVKE